MRNLVLALLAMTLFSCSQREERKIAEKNKAAVVYENIMNRRSIRAYKDQPVPRAQLDSIVQCAIHAPSANNKQSWQVRVIQDQEMMRNIRNINPSFSYNAPNLIVVAKEKENPISAVDCGLLAQNILLMAEAMDLGTVVLGGMVGVINSPDAKDIMDALDFPATHEVVFAIAIGYKDEQPATPVRDMSKVRFISMDDV